MNLRVLLVVALAMTGTTLALAPVAQASLACTWTSPFPANPFPGGVARSLYATTTTAGNSVGSITIVTTCAVLVLTVNTTNAACRIVIGTDCI